MNLPQRTGRGLVLTGMLVGCLLAAGCQSNPEPAPLPSQPPSASASSIPSPTVAAPTLPPEARGTSTASAKAFVRHYVSLVNYGMKTGEVEDIVALSASSCGSCRAVADNIRSVYAQGGRLVGNGWRVTAVQEVMGPGKGAPIIQVGIFVSPQKRFENETAAPKSFEGGPQLMTFRLARTDTWLVANWSQST